MCARCRNRAQCVDTWEQKQLFCSAKVACSRICTCPALLCPALPFYALLCSAVSCLAPLSPFGLQSVSRISSPTHCSRLQLGKLDSLLTWLWRVHGVDYYAGVEIAEPDAEQRSGPRPTLRCPRPEEGEQVSIGLQGLEVPGPCMLPSPQGGRAGAQRAYEY